MSLSVHIQKKLGKFTLDVHFDSDRTPLALLGASGCGKSVTLRCIAGILTPDEGRIVLAGRTLFDSAAGISLPPQKRQVGYLFQNYALFPHMTVRQNIAAAISEKQLRASKTTELLHRFRLEDVANLKPAQLSGGQQQRCALARILASDPTAILLDEPFSALDSYLKNQLELELADTLSAFSGSVVWVSHDRGEVFRNCRQVCVLDQGKSTGLYTLRELFHAPVTEAAARLSGCENFAAAIPAPQGVTLPQWSLTLVCQKELPPDLRCIGIRARHVIPAMPSSENQVRCAVLRVVQDVFHTIVLLRPEHAAHNAPPLRMELAREDWQALANPSHLTVSIPSRDILLLQ